MRMLLLISDLLKANNLDVKLNFQLYQKSLNGLYILIVWTLGNLASFVTEEIMVISTDRYDAE